MEDKALYTQILSIQPPWEIDHIDLDMARERVDVYVEWPSKEEAPCSVCQQEQEETMKALAAPSYTRLDLP